jgi:hypothetical protein
MQIYANVAADAVWTPAKSLGLKGCWMFRAGEAFKEKDGQQQESTWYTVKDYGTAEDHNPVYGKGDFLKILGRLKPAAWMNRAGKPDTTLYVHAFDISVERKVGQKTVTKSAQAFETTEAVAPKPVQNRAQPQAIGTTAQIAEAEEPSSCQSVLSVKGVLQGDVSDAPDWTLL